MSSIHSSGPSLSSFQALAKAGEAVALKGGELRSTSATPAKQGFFSRIMNWVRGESSSKINSETKSAFIASIGRGLTKKGIENVLNRGGFDAGRNKPLTSREIMDVSRAKSQLLEEGRQLRSLMNEMKVIRADIKHKESIYAAKSKAVAKSPSRETYLPSKAALEDFQAARTQGLAHAEKIKAMVKQMNH